MEMRGVVLSTREFITPREVQQMDWLLWIPFMEWVHWTWWTTKIISKYFCL